MDKTTNFDLPQWVKADQIKMDDFNGAFASIDAALKAEGDARSEANCLVKLAGPLVTAADNAEMNFDLSQVDMTQVAALFFTFCAGSSSGNMEISVNGTSLGTVCSNSWSTTAGILWLVPMSGDVSFVSTLVLNNSNGTAGYGGCGAVKWDAVNKVTLAGTSSAGATATLFAVKK